MQPQDFPVEILAETESRLVGMADHQRNRARGWQNGYGHDGTPTDYPDKAARIGLYESALAYYEAARQVAQGGTEVVRKLADLAQREQKPVHRWPLPFTMNQAALHPDSTGALPNADVRFPRWGIDADTANPNTETYVSLCPTSDRDGDMILRVSTGEAGAAHRPPTTEQTVRISQAQWASLAALAARIAAGEPIPYDENGNTFTPGKADR